MLFNSFSFVLLFLPAVLAGYAACARVHVRLAMAWLVLASLFFYGWWNPVYVGLLAGSAVINYGLGQALTHDTSQARRRLTVIAGVTANLAVLGWFKYANFFVDTADTLTGLHLELSRIVLPLGISFFTFQKIAYLVDCHRRLFQRHGLLDFLLFVTFFPQLIAGPIVHPRDTIPQFRRLPSSLRSRDLAIGFSIFAIGLFKKVMIADPVAQHANAVFAAAGAGDPLTMGEAWIGAIAYTLQIYFDFSGYTDMAIGLARLFGVRLPLNFNSPYKASSIVEFWRRWHMTLSRFLRDYLYFPLGGNRKGPLRRYLNLMAVMLLGGLWHGAGWTFVVWGGLHGVYLIVNHLWSSLFPSASRGAAARAAAGLLTFLAVTVAWVVFRSESWTTALAMLRAMAGAGGLSLPHQIQLAGLAIPFPGVRYDGLSPNALVDPRSLPWLGLLLVVCWFAPNTGQIMRRYAPALDAAAALDRPSSLGRVLTWRPTFIWSAAAAAILLVSILNLSNVSEFIYFQF